MLELREATFSPLFSLPHFPAVCCCGHRITDLWFWLRSALRSAALFLLVSPWGHHAQGSTNPLWKVGPWQGQPREGATPHRSQALELNGSDSADLET